MSSPRPFREVRNPTLRYTLLPVCESPTLRPHLPHADPVPEKYSTGRTVLDSSDEEDESEEESEEVKAKRLQKRLEKMTPKPGTKGQMSRVARILHYDSLGMFVEPVYHKPTKRKVPDKFQELAKRKKPKKRVTHLDQSSSEDSSEDPDNE